MQMKYIG